jgi:hypothetical protein
MYQAQGLDGNMESFCFDLTRRIQKFEEKGELNKTSPSWSQEVKVPVFLGGLPESFSV